MRRESAEEVAEAARRRLALLGEELARSGFEPAQVGAAQVEAARVGPDDAPVDAPLDAPLEPAPVPAPGRHSRRRPAPMSDRGAAWLQDRVPATLRGRVSLGVGHVAVLAVVAAVALGVTAYLTIRARPTVAPVPQ